MSAWRLIAQELHRAGHPLSSRQFYSAPPKAAWVARDLGIVELVGHPPYRGAPAVWTLTQRGIDWCAGRVRVVYRFKRGYEWVAV